MRGGILGSFVALGLLVGLAAPAAATHFRFGTLTWRARPDISPTTVEFDLTASFRRSGYTGSAADGRPTIGDTIEEFIGFTQLFPGDGTSLGSPLQFEVIAIDPIQDWLLAKAELSDPGAPDKVVLHTYPSENDGGAPWVAAIDSCCRISIAEHINNRSGNYRVETLVDLTLGDNPPVTGLQPIVSCELGAVCQFIVPAIDAEEGELRFRLSEPAEASAFGGFVQPGPPNAPNALEIDPSSGIVTWDTTGATIGPAGFGLYSAQVTVEELLDGNPVSKTAVDFFVRVAPVPPFAPQFDSPPSPEAGSVLSVGVGETLTIDLKASDADAGDLVLLGNTGLPQGMICDLGGQANPAIGSCDWTPDDTQVGSYILIFTATDTFGLGSTPLVLQVDVTEVLCEATDPFSGVAFGQGWSMAWEISEDDGLVLRNVRLGTRKMAERVSIPYLLLDTSEGPPERYELRTDCADEPGRSGLVSFSRNTNSERMLLEARYRIDQLLSGTGSSLEVVQHYEFRKVRPEGGCEPSKAEINFGPVEFPPPIQDDREFPCNPYKFTVTYEFDSQGGEAFQDIEIPQRMHFRPDNDTTNTGKFFEDANNLFELGFPPNIIQDDMRVDAEGVEFMLFDGNRGNWDNYHQSSRSLVTAPNAIPSAPGCPECVHMHWRWSALTIPPEFGQGQPIIPRTDLQFDGLFYNYDSNQDLLFANTLYRAGEEDPTTWLGLINGEALHNKDIVSWYVSRGFLPRDSFFIHFGFFSASYVGLSLDISTPVNPVALGEDIPYAVTVTNAGPGMAHNVTVTLDAFDSFFLADESDSRCQGAGGQVTCFLNALGSNRSWTFDLVFDPLTPNSFPAFSQLNGEVRADEVEITDDDNDVQHFTEIVAPTNMTLDGQESPDPARVGQDLEYELFLENLSLAEARDVRVIFDIASTAAIIDWDPSTGDCTLSPSGVELVCDLGKLQAGFLGVIDITARPGKPGNLFASARIETSTPDYEPESNSVSFTTNVRP